VDGGKASRFPDQDQAGDLGNGVMPAGHEAFSIPEPHLAVRDDERNNRKQNPPLGGLGCRAK